ncbi:cytochrome P450 [Nonomuraea sp. NPDC050556]|uniref:cytochrome P450 n=1 Tax=Nonomuraea sp. NPDC050556 TaxID=3364369 RepID=UPI003795C947
MTHSFPVQRSCPFAPPDEYATFRDEAPLVRAQLPGGKVWLVTRHAEAQQVLRDPGISTNPMTPGHPNVMMEEEPPTPEQLAMFMEFAIGQFIDLDPPEHTRFRKLLIPEFSLRRVRDMRPGIQEAVDTFLSEMKPGDDLVQAFGLPVPSLVICQLLGVPYEDRDFFHSRTRKLVMGDFTVLPEIRSYLDGLVTEAEKQPGDNLIGRVIKSEVLAHDEIVGAAVLLLIAGHETTANMIPLSVLSLVRNPDQLALLRADPSLWPQAVEELLRYHSIVDWVAFDRVATTDQEIGGVQVRAGEGIYVLGASANRDPRAFENPDVLDVTRGDRHHVAFGYGVHQCLGQNLARAELEIALRTLFERIPGLTVTVPDEELTFKYGAAVFGVEALPVSW